MKNIFLVLSLLIGSIVFAQAQGQYESGMKQAFKLWEENKSVEAVALFERIGQAESEKWHPLYYAAQVLIVQTFQDGKMKMEDKSLLLEKAKKVIADAHKRSPDNSEIWTLEGLLYTGYVAMDPNTYGMMYTSKIMGLHAKAVELNPKNPRARANQIEYEMGGARFFKQDLTPFCERLKEVLPMFDNQETKEPFDPSRGKERVEQVIKDCGQ